MSKKFDRRILDTNAMVMGGGVGLAALESMFNLVQAQSLISANMVRDYEQSSGQSLKALVVALGEVLETGANSPARTCPKCSCTKEQSDTSGNGGFSDALDNGANSDASSNNIAPSAEKLLSQIFDMLGTHMTELNDDILELSGRQLMVT